MSACGGKADMPFCAANVRYWVQSDLPGGQSRTGSRLSAIVCTLIRPR